MKLEFKGNALDFLRAKGYSELTLDIEDIPTNCCTGHLPEVQISHISPAAPEQYRNFFIQGINVHISKMLRTENTLTIFLSPPFKQLEVAGLNLIL